MNSYYDVIVCGAGPGGVGAALGAAKTGRKVLLVDQHSGPGGVAVYCGCPVFQGINSWTDNQQGGVVSEFVAALRGHGEIINHFTLNSSEFEVSLALNRLLGEAGVERLFYTTLIGTLTEKHRIRAVELFSCGKRFQVEAASFVDATGDAVLSELAGVELLEGSPEETMTKSLLFRVAGVEDFNKTKLIQQFPELNFPFPEQNRFMGTPIYGGHEILLNLTAVAGNAMDPSDKTRMELELREQIPVILQWARKSLPGFAHCRLTGVAPVMGVRGSRNIVARKMITGKDLTENSPVGDSVAVGKCSYGEHYVHQFTSPWSLRSNQFRGIPYGSLLPVDIDNLSVAGRCIGIEPRAGSAVRLMPVCMAVGQAAGAAAALNFPSYEILHAELQRQKTKTGEK